ncbi:MAG: protein translocase subunit SecF, partial [Treponema sp.]|nr:protein translocase subunit SecF [Treponema sp.]
EEKFGKNNVAIVRTDFIGSSFSKSIAFQSIIVLIGSILLIFLYSAFRFHWDFALGAVLALIHDVLIILSFLVWTQLEFSTMIVAAILTIVGYSINATIVILDRERSLLPIMNAKKFTDIINQALSDTLTRSVITTLTTLFAAVALYVFTSGDIKNFSLALIVGLISGCYSSIFISSAFIVATRKNWKPEYGIHHSLKTQTGVFNAGVTV